MKTGKKNIRVMLVDDSLLAITMLKRILATAPDIEVVATCHNGRDAINLLPQVRPDVICTDYHMPVMDGLAMTEYIMAHHPTPILVVSVSVQQQGDEENIFRLLEAGAIDVCPKPLGGLAADYTTIQEELVNKIRLLSGVVAISKRHKPIPPLSELPKTAPLTNRPAIVAIGASTGGPQTISAILGRLSADFPAPIVCVQHISTGFQAGLISWLNSHTPLQVREAKPGEKPEAGTVYFPVEGYHLIIDNTGRLQAIAGEPIDGHCPSITATFSSIAAYYQQASVAILLTGMGRDGAKGLLEISRAGGTTVAQNEESCIVFGMPAEAIKLGAAQHILAPEEIAQLLTNRIRFQKTRL